MLKCVLAGPVVAMARHGLCSPLPDVASQVAGRWRVESNYSAKQTLVAAGKGRLG